MVRMPGDDVVVDLGTGAVVSGVRVRVCVEGRSAGARAYVVCASAPIGNLRLGETVNEAPIFIITAERSYPATVCFLQAFVVEPAKTIQPLCLSAMATGARDIVSKEPTC